MSIRRLSRQLTSSLTCNPSGLVFVGANYAFATSATIPPHIPGDLIVVFARRSANAAAPTAPTASGTVPTWTTAIASASGYGSSRTAYASATTNATTTGTWTNANGIIVVVLRRATGIGGAAAVATQTVASPAPAITLTRTNGTSAILHFFGYGDGANSVTSISAAPGGYTQRINARSGNIGLVLLSKNDTGSDGAIIQPGSVASFAGFASVEVLAS